ncbi:MAG: helicase C-terminal domain-containing protein [Kiritimatiellia bacterium]
MKTAIRTVWVEKKEGSTPSFSVHPQPVAGDEAVAEVIYLTNELTAFEGFFSERAELVADILTLCSLIGLRRGDAPIQELLTTGCSAAEALWSLWQRVEAVLEAKPLWALELIEAIYHNLEEHALSRLIALIAERVRASGRNCGAWTEGFSYRNKYPEKRNLPLHADCEAADVDAIASHLMPGGSFSAILPGYETRLGQVKMLCAVASAFNGRQHLVVEAGTGVGKSLAYLLPAAVWSQLNSVPVVVSTNTRNLQSQLLDKDLPLVQRVLDAGRAVGKSPLKVALLKGRTNYLCLRQLGVLIDYNLFEFERPELRHFARAVVWALQTVDGDLDNFAGLGHANPGFLSKLASSGEECAGRGCRYYKRCFMQQARLKALEADVIVANHSLVFADSQSGGTIFPPHAQIIFDEAHNLEEAATRHLSVEISTLRLMVILTRISRGREGRRGGVIEMLKRHLEKGTVSKDQELVRLLLDKIDTVKTLMERVRRCSAKFFDACGGMQPAQGESVRFRCIPDLEERVAPDARFGANTPLHRLKRQVFNNGAFVSCPDSHDEELVQYSKDALKQSVAEVASHLQEVADKLRQATAEELSLFSDQAMGLDSAAQRLREFACDLDFVTAATEPEYVFWLEPGRGGRERRVSFVAAPLSIAKNLHDLFYQNKDSCIFCSATLRVSGSFQYINRRLGFDQIEPARFVEAVAESPFNYLTQCAVYAAGFMPEPTGEGRLSYVDQLSAMMFDLFVKTDGRALGLFTSYEMMNHVAELLEEPLLEAGIKLLVHGKSGTRDQLTRVFRNGGKCALLGTHSFWEGVDVTGEALSCVVLARLPFAVVGDPVVEARCEQIQLAGGNSFRDFSLPQAVIRFRQGFGRLIRTTEDRGVVVIADPRIITKRYGSSFVRSLPCPIIKLQSPEDLLRRVGGFLG